MPARWPSCTVLVIQRLKLSQRNTAAAVGAVACMMDWPYTGRTMPTDPNRRRSERIEVRATPEERALIDRAVAAAGTNATAFVLNSVTTAARRVLADRTEFVLSPEAASAWETINERPARDLPGLRRLMQRPSPFVAE